MVKKKDADSFSVDPFSEREAQRYANPIVSREAILRFIETNGPSLFKHLAKNFSIKGQERREGLRRRLIAMLRDGQLLQDSDENFCLLQQMQCLQGRVEAHRDGFGFLLQDEGEDVFLSQREMRKVFHGDEVLVEIIGKSKKGGVEGRIVDIVTRHAILVVGRLNRNGKHFYVVPDNPRIVHDIYIDNDLAESKAENNSIKNASIGDYVTVEILSYPQGPVPAKGKISEVLGGPLAPGIEIELAIRSFDIPWQWPQAALAEAAKLDSEPLEEDKEHRVDLRSLPLVTIDGEDARDFDDAVYCEQKKEGFTLWVAIADVSHYVPVLSALDNEAAQRGNSVYFPGRVVPMLPESISNGLCSLNPQTDRLCMVCEMQITAMGVVSSYEFYEGVMRSHARLTYNEVAEVLNLSANPPRAGLQERVAPVLAPLQNLYALFSVLTQARKKRGAIDFESAESQIIFNAQKKIETIIPVVRNDAHKIIEECMLAANVAAADFLQQAKLAALYRVHEGPKAQKLQNLREYLGELGLSLAGLDKPHPNDYQKLMQAIADRPDRSVIQTMMLRSMNQAVYQADNQGHFGLSYTAYTHFTSPIRRYPDLLTHRAIRHCIRSRKAISSLRRVNGATVMAKKNIYPYAIEDIVQAGLQCSMTERRADDATRDVVAKLKCEYLSEHVNSSFVGVISGVSNFGFFVELNDLFVEGLVHVTSLQKDYFIYDAAKQRLIGERTRKVFQLGDSVNVLVADVDIEARKINLTLDGAQAQSGKKISSRESKKSKRKSDNKAQVKKSAKKAGKTTKRKKITPVAKKAAKKAAKKSAANKGSEKKASKAGAKKNKTKIKALKKVKALKRKPN